MKHALPLLACALALPLVACADEPSVEATITPLACGRLTCDLDRPLAVGSHLAFQSQPLGLVTSARVSEPSLATVTAGFLQAEDAYTVTGLAPGRVTIELLDEHGDVVGARALEIAAADHLEATVTLVGASGTSQLDRVVAEQPQPVPASAIARISVDARRDADPLNGWSEYTFEPTLTNGARVIRWDREGNATIDLRAGEQSVRFVSASTSLGATFVLAAQ